MEMATIEEILSRVQAELQEHGAEIWVENGEVFIRPPADWASEQSFSDIFYDYCEYLEAGWVLDANEDETLFWLKRAENVDFFAGKTFPADAEFVLPLE
jgi:hypothetical protein